MNQLINRVYLEPTSTTGLGVCSLMIGQNLGTDQSYGNKHRDMLSRGHPCLERLIRR